MEEEEEEKAELQRSKHVYLKMEGNKVCSPSFKTSTAIYFAQPLPIYFWASSVSIKEHDVSTWTLHPTIKFIHNGKTEREKHTPHWRIYKPAAVDHSKTQHKFYHTLRVANRN